MNTVVYRQTSQTRARKADKRRKLLLAARTLVSEGGFANAGVAAIAARAEVATGTVYRYFPSKSDLFAEVFRLAFAREVEIMREATLIPGTPPLRLANAITRWASRAVEGRTLAYALIAEPTTPRVEAERLRFRRAYAEVLASVIADGDADGTFTVPDVGLAAAGIVGALAEGLVGPLAPAHAETDADALVHSLTTFCLQALGARIPESEHAHP